MVEEVRIAIARTDKAVITKKRRRTRARRLEQNTSSKLLVRKWLSADSSGTLGGMIPRAGKSCLPWPVTPDFILGY